MSIYTTWAVERTGIWKSESNTSRLFLFFKFKDCCSKCDKKANLLFILEHEDIYRILCEHCIVPLMHTENLTNDRVNLWHYMTENIKSIQLTLQETNDDAEEKVD